MPLLIDVIDQTMHCRLRSKLHKRWLRSDVYEKQWSMIGQTGELATKNGITQATTADHSQQS